MNGEGEGGLLGVLDDNSGLADVLGQHVFVFCDRLRKRTGFVKKSAGLSLMIIVSVNIFACIVKIVNNLRNFSGIKLTNSSGSSKFNTNCNF